MTPVRIRLCLVLGLISAVAMGEMASQPVKQFSWTGGLHEGQYANQDSGSVPTNMWSGRFTVEAKIKTPAKGKESGWQIFFNRSSRDQACKGLLFGLKDMELRFGRQCNPHPSTGVRLEPNASYHVAVTYDGGLAAIYVNGLKRKSISLITEFTNAGAFVIGAGRSTGGERFLGEVCEVNIYHPGGGPDFMAQLHKDASKHLCGESTAFTYKRMTHEQAQEVEITCKSSRENRIHQGSAKWTQVGDLRSTIEADTDGVLISSVLGRVTGPEKNSAVFRASHFLDEQLMTAPQADYTDFLMHGVTPHGRFAPFSFVQMKAVNARVHSVSVMGNPKGDGWLVRDAVLQSATLSSDATSELNAGEPVLAVTKDWQQVGNLQTTVTAKRKSVAILTANAHVRPQTPKDNDFMYFTFYGKGNQVVTKQNYGLFHTYGAIGKKNYQPASMMQMMAVDDAANVEFSLRSQHSGHSKKWEIAEANMQVAVIPHATLHERYSQNWSNKVPNSKGQWVPFLGKDFRTVANVEAEEALIIMTVNGHTRATSGQAKGTLEASFQVGKERIKCEAMSAFHINGDVPGLYWAPFSFVQIAKVPKGKHEITLVTKTQDSDWAINGVGWQIAVVESTALARAKRQYGHGNFKLPEGRAPAGYAGTAEFHLFLKQLEDLRVKLKRVEMDQNLSSNQRAIEMERLKGKILEKEVAISRNEAPSKIEDQGITETHDDRGLRIETGSVWPKSSHVDDGIYHPWALENAHVGKDPNGKYDYKQKITFKKPFMNTPVVSAAVRGFAILPSTAKRFNVWVTNTTRTDFTLVMESWGGTRVHEALVNWVAVGQDPDLMKRALALSAQIERETRIHEDLSNKFQKSKNQVQHIEAESRKMYEGVKKHLAEVVKYHKTVEKYLAMHGDKGLEQIRKEWKTTKEFEHAMMARIRSAMSAAEKLMKEIKTDIKAGHAERERIAAQSKSMETHLEENFKHYESEIDEINRFINTDPDSIHNELKAKIAKFTAGNEVTENGGVLRNGFQVMESPQSLAATASKRIGLLEVDENLGSNSRKPDNKKHVPCRCYSKSENLVLEEGLAAIGMPGIGEGDKACYCDSNIAAMGDPGEEFEFSL